jgi:hypothetical protein
MFRSNNIETFAQKVRHTRKTREKQKKNHKDDERKKCE